LDFEVDKKKWTVTKEVFKKVLPKKNGSKKAPHATLGRCHMGASSLTFFCHSIS